MRPTLDLTTFSYTMNIDLSLPFKNHDPISLDDCVTHILDISLLFPSYHPRYPCYASD